MIALALFFSSPVQADAWSLVRVDQGGFPGAEASSARGSVLLEPPTDGTAWRIESVPEVDDLSLTEVWDPRATAVTGLDAWHAAGHLGQNIRVAIFDIQWFGADFREAELGEYQSHDCWVDPLCETPIDSLRPRFDFERGSHGVACAEIVRDLAPESELHLVRVNGQTTFENAVDWAIREQVDLISMSMTFFNESFYDGSGPISEQIDRLDAAGILMVTSAGNNGERHYQDSFRDRNNNGFHEFHSGSEYLPIRAKAGDGRVAAVLWDEFQDCGKSDLGIQLLDSRGNTIRRQDHFQDFENEKCTPVERIRAPIELDGEWVYLRIERLLGEGPLPIDIMSFSGGIFGAIAENSMADPAPHAGSFTVGAVHVEDYMHNPVEPFSSQGPSRGPTLKPNLVAPDGLSTRTYGANRFFGTSASAPVAASALAVRLSADPSLSPQEGAKDLEAWAWSGSNTWTQPDPAMVAGRLGLRDLHLEKKEGCTSGALHATLLLLPLFVVRRKRIEILS